MQIGANYVGEGACEFVVWAPHSNKVGLKIIFPRERVILMSRDEWGYWRTRTKDISAGSQYLYVLDGKQERPDPASHFQPEGVHGTSAIIDHTSFPWQDQKWAGMPLEEMIMYELHVGTFTPEGTFVAAISRLDDLLDLGINAIEVMPVSQFPGQRNWGYDGVYPFAVQNSYGGPPDFKKLIDACHGKGIAVILDVVYNHLGPEGNYLREFGPYFTGKYTTPWGEAINFDDACSDHVRNFFIENALFWFEQYHIDALRLDAIHAIYDMSAKPFLQELAEAVDEFSKQQGRKFYLIAESDLNDARVIRPSESGGYGIDAQWSDDFHHSVHTLLTGDDRGYYRDFGRTEDLAKSLREGFVYTWRYSCFRKRHHGNSAADRPAHQFVVCIQNHDQVGNRMLGERLSQLISFEGQKLAAGCLLLSPFVPLLFMGEEYGEENPFQYFVSHTDPALVQAVRRGRKAEFAQFKWQEEPPDPQSPETFQHSKLQWQKRSQGRHKMLLDFYKRLIGLRKTIPALRNPDNSCLQVSYLEEQKFLHVQRWQGGSHVLGFFNFNDETVHGSLDLPDGEWQKILDSAGGEWQGPGSVLPVELRDRRDVILQPLSLALFLKK